LKFLSAYPGFTKAVLLAGTLLVMGVALCLDGREPEPVPHLTADKDPGWLRGLAFAGDTLLLATDGMVVPPSQISKLRLWNAATGEERPALAGHAGEILTMAFSPDGKQVATAGWDRSIKVWDAATGRERAVLRQATNARRPLAFDARSRLGWVEDEIVNYWDPATRAVEPVPGLKVGSALCLAISLDGRLLATVDCEKFVARLWEVPAGCLRAELPRDAFSITCVAFAPDCRVLATGNARGVVALWNIGAAQQITTFTRLPACARGLAFSTDGKQLAAGDVGGNVRIWDIATKRELRALSTADMEHSHDTRTTMEQARNLARKRRPVTAPRRPGQHSRAWTDLPPSVGEKQDELMQSARPVDDIDIRLNRWLVYFASNPGWYPVGEFIAADATSPIERAIEVFRHGLAYRARRDSLGCRAPAQSKEQRPRRTESDEALHAGQLAVVARAGADLWIMPLAPVADARAIRDVALGLVRVGILWPAPCGRAPRSTPSGLLLPSRMSRLASGQSAPGGSDRPGTSRARQANNARCRWRGESERQDTSNL
jgi:hypothetical protein